MRGSIVFFLIYFNFELIPAVEAIPAHHFHLSITLQAKLVYFLCVLFTPARHREPEPT
jgi:hypothetical protein